MLKQIKKLLSRPAPQTDSLTPISYRQQQHNIDQRHISDGVLKVIRDLQHAGYQAYLVGGGVRDLLLGATPKDFDVATDAHPEQVQAVFKRALIIGRRFKIVHVRMGREVFEVTTFRGAHDSNNRASQQSEKGVLVRDNVYGSLDSDAMRRDFTVNALYYNPSSRELLDYTDGFKDLKRQTLRIIGNADDRYKEDPVRMLRAIRFACKLGFSLSPETEAPIRAHAEYLKEIPPARLFEEVLKLFMAGNAEQVLASLQDYHLLNYLFPGTSRALAAGERSDTELLRLAARNTDTRIRDNKRVTPAFIYAAFLWPTLLANQRQLRENPSSQGPNLYQVAAQQAISEQLGATSIPKRFLMPMREIWDLQARFDKRDARRAYALLENPRFRAAYDFLLLREEAGELNAELGEWWTRFQHADQEEQKQLLSEVRPQGPRGRSRRRPRKKIGNAD